MRRQPYSVISPIKGVDLHKHPLLIQDTSGPNVTGARINLGALCKEVPWYTFSADLPLTGAVKLIDTLYTGGGSAFLLVVTTSYVYLYDPNTDTFTIKNQASLVDPFPPVAFTGTDDDNVQGTIFLDNTGTDIYILANGVDPIQKWDGTGLFKDLGGLTGITARAVIPFMNHLILGYTVETGTACARRVRWSATGDPEDWTTLANGAGFVELVDTVDWIVTFFKVRDKLFILKERSIWELMYVGGTQIFVPQLRIDGIGGYSAKAVMPLGEEALIYGSDNIYSFDGLDLTPVGDFLLDKLYSTATKVVNSEKLNRATSIYIEEINEGWFVVPTSGENPDLMLKYNLTEEAWIFDTREATAFGYYSIPLGETWASATDDWDDYTGIVWFGTVLPSGAPITLIGTKDGYVYQDTRGVAPYDQSIVVTSSMSYESKDWMFGHASRITEVRFNARGGPCSISYSLDKGVTWSSPVSYATLSNWTECSLHINQTTESIRVRIKVEAATDSFELLWIEPWFIERVRSRRLQRS